MVRHVGRQVTATSGQILGLLQGQTIAAHQHLQVAVIPEAHHHADTGEVIPNPLPHADAVGPLVGLRWRLEIVVKAVEPTDEGVVEAGALIGQFAVAEIDAAVVLDADEGPLPGCRTVAPLPDTTAELEVPQGNRDLPSGAVDMALVHRPGHITEGGTVLISVQLSIPALQQPETNPARIEGQGIHLIVGDVVEGFPLPAAVPLLGLITDQRRAGGRGRGDGDQAAHHDNGSQQQPSPVLSTQNR